MLEDGVYFSFENMIKIKHKNIITKDFVLETECLAKDYKYKNKESSFKHRSTNRPKTYLDLGWFNRALCCQLQALLIDKLIYNALISFDRKSIISKLVARLTYL